jgi:hypothetical protein
MERIIAARFQTVGEADAAAASMPYIDSTDICIFHNNPPGQHGTLMMGGDEDEDPSAAGAGKTSAATAVSAGLAAGAIGALGGPVVAAAAAAVGAYAGSMAGAMAGLGAHEDKAHSHERPAGIMLSVRIAEPANEERVIATLRAEGAADIEMADGVWRDGGWSDFDPVAAPRLVEGAAD